MDESNEFKNRDLQNLHLWNSNIEIYHNCISGILFVFCKI